MLQSAEQHPYPSDLSDSQWELIQQWIPSARAGGRPRTTSTRQVMNAIFYLIQSGCAWRLLPKGFPPWRTVYDYYGQWRDQGIITKIHEFLVKSVRVSEGKSESPHALIVDSQSVKAQFGEKRGYDGFKKIRGRKRHIFTDTLGLIHRLKVNSAYEKDHQPAIDLIDPSAQDFPVDLKKSLEVMYADGAYLGKFEAKVYAWFGFWPTLKVSQKIKSSKDAKILTESNLTPKRWIVERTFAWLNHFRRLTRDYERKASSSETMIYLAMIRMMLTRIARGGKVSRWA